ncbi:glycosyltransferase family 61 protein [Methylobacterium sp. 88A]|uniref:glycosyltransferase family 61 protein n=1 Tax=Methylobacterium sp. 88A TaxID=1131813 RepID=UPI0003A7BEFF|nr:glycosyltransferase family 61 protein [Methylobacterium sp. 88A]
MTKPKDKALDRSARETLKLCRADVEQGRWNDVVARTHDPTLILSLPQLLIYRLSGALATGRDDVIDEVAGHVSSLTGREAIAYAVIRDLVANRRSGLAGRVLLDNAFLHVDHRLLDAASTIIRNTLDEDLQIALGELKKVASRGGSEMKPMPTEFRFSPQPSIDHLGSVKVQRSSATSPHHVIALRREARLFRKVISAQLQPKVLERRNVFTSAIGQIWTEDGRILRPRKSPIPWVERSSVPQIGIALSSNRPSAGIYHWLVDHLPRFAFLGDSGLVADDTFKVLLNGSNPGFEQTSLDMIGLGDSTYRIDRPVFVERLLVPVVPFEGMAGWRHLDSVFAVMVERAIEMARAHGVTLPERVYITRRDAKRRPLTNEVDIEQVMQSHGFEIAEFSTLPLWHQIAIAHQASVIASPHGGGLAHLIFSRPKTRVIEILPIKDGAYNLRFNYARLCLTKGHDYVAWMEPQPVKGDAWTVDLRAFGPFLARTMRGA